MDVEYTETVTEHDLWVQEHITLLHLPQQQRLAIVTAAHFNFPLNDASWNNFPAQLQGLCWVIETATVNCGRAVAVKRGETCGRLKALLTHGAGK